MQREELQAAQNCARALLSQFGVQRPEDIRLERFAERYNARVVFAPLDGAEAQLVRANDSATITLAERIKDEVAWRFNLAHEIGHLALAHPSPRAAELACNPQRASRSTHEAEASACGSELLMPEALVAPTCQVAKADLEVPHAIARDYKVSILASAIRFTDLTNARCAAVFSCDGKVKWCARSSGFKKAIPRNMPLERTSLAYDYFERGELGEGPRRVPADAWLKTAADVEIVEHSICSPKHRTVLSMLWIPESVAADLGMRA